MKVTYKYDTDFASVRKNNFSKKELTTLIDKIYLNWLQGVSVLSLITAKMKYQIHTDQTVDIRIVYLLLQRFRWLLPMYHLFCRRSFNLDGAGYRTLFRR